ncbi:MAG: S-adenosylmethionine:tRNA ribosyltransferase-isomerase [Byssovorax sp.]
MKPARHVRDDSLRDRLLVIDPRDRSITDARVADLPSLLRAGDLLIVNDGATLPGSLAGRTASGAAVEARLVAERAPGLYTAILFGAGDWRMRTEDRPPPPPLAEGAVIDFGSDLHATLAEVSPHSPRLVALSFREQGDALWAGIYRHGRPIQYSYIDRPLELYHVQTAYASRPICAELCSAGRPLTWGLLLDLARRGVRVARLTHAAGISSTGDPALDARLPLPERYEIPAETIEAIREARARGGRVIAVGTTVTRALEGCALAHGGALVPGPGVTDLVLGPRTPLRVVDGIFTGVHEPTESHYELLSAFAPEPLLREAHAHAEREGYLGHELGDSCLILARDDDPRGIRRLEAVARG